MTAAGEWLPRDWRPSEPSDADAPPPAPAPLVSGAIGRGLDDARARYRAELVALWHGVVDELPDD